MASNRYNSRPAPTAEQDSSMFDEGIYCPTCGYDMVCVQFNVGTIGHNDQTYTLSCGHTVSGLEQPLTAQERNELERYLNS